MQRDFDILKALTCVYMLTMREQNRAEPARARRDQRSLHHGFVRRRRPGLGILTGIPLRAEALYVQPAVNSQPCYSWGDS